MVLARRALREIGNIFSLFSMKNNANSLHNPPHIPSTPGNIFALKVVPLPKHHSMKKDVGTGEDRVVVVGG